MQVNCYNGRKAPSVGMGWTGWRKIQTFAPLQAVRADPAVEELSLDINRHYKQGQAMVEFCIGLVGVLVVVAAVVQLGVIGMARTTVRTEATAQVSNRSLNTPSDDFSYIRTYIRAVEDGPDQRAYSLDDAEDISGQNQAFERLHEENDASFLRTIDRDNDLASISSSDDMQAVTGFVQAQAIEPNVGLLPIIRRLFFSESSLDVETEVWSIYLGDFY